MSNLSSYRLLNNRNLEPSSLRTAMPSLQAICGGTCEYQTTFTTFFLIKFRMSNLRFGLRDGMINTKIPGLTLGRRWVPGKRQVSGQTSGFPGKRQVPGQTPGRRRVSGQSSGPRAPPGHSASIQKDRTSAESPLYYETDR